MWLECRISLCIYCAFVLNAPPATAGGLIRRPPSCGKRSAFAHACCVNYATSATSALRRWSCRPWCHKAVAPQLLLPPPAWALALPHLTAAPPAARVSAPPGATGGPLGGHGSLSQDLRVCPTGQRQPRRRPGALRGDRGDRAEGDGSAERVRQRRNRAEEKRRRFGAETAARIGNGYVAAKMLRARLLHHAILRLLGALLLRCRLTLG